MKKLLVIMLVIFFFPAYCLAQEGESFALIDWDDNKVVILDFSGNILFEKDFNGIGVCYFISPSVDGWLVKGCSTPGCWGEDWIIWQLQRDGSISNTITGLGPGPFYTGIGSGNFITGNVYTGVIDLYSGNGVVIDSINVWEEEEGLPYDYSRLGDTAGLVSGGFVVPPQGGWPSIGQLYTPYLYYYDNDLNLINTLDITAVDMRLLALTGISDGGFAGTCAAHGTGYDVESLCWFDSEGGLAEVVDVTNDLPYRQYMNVFIAGLSDGRAMLTVYGRDKVWIYDPPSSGGFFSASQPEELDLSGAGVSAIGGIAGNVLMVNSECEGDLDCDGVLDDEDNCPDHPNGPTRGTCTEDSPALIVNNQQYCTDDGDCDSGEYCEKSQSDNYPPGSGNNLGDACDCEGNFNCDQSVDGLDVTPFLAYLNKRLSVSNPCTNSDPCKGDFNCDTSVDAQDIGKFTEDWNKRLPFSNPCPPCDPEVPWCSY